MEALLSALAGLGLAAAAGFRVFVPPLVLSLAARSGHFELAPGLGWLASDAALITFAVATVLEIGAYYIPWLDNLLDTLATPTAVVAGVLLAAAALGHLDPWLRWTLAVVAGGGLAAVFQGVTAGARGLSSLTTGGVGNPLLATLEAGASLVLAVLAVLLPVAALVAVAALLYLLVSRWVFRRSRREAA